MIPNAKHHKPAPEYLRELIARAGKTQRDAARIIGVPERTMRYYLADPDSPARSTVAPYAVQFALECLAGHAR